MKIKKRANASPSFKKPQKYCVAPLVAVENQKGIRKELFSYPDTLASRGTLKIFFDHSYLHMLNVLLLSSQAIFFDRGTRFFRGKSAT